MDPELVKIILELIDAVTNVCESTDKDARDFGRQILTHLSRINSTLESIDLNLNLLEANKLPSINDNLSAIRNALFELELKK